MDPQPYIVYFHRDGHVEAATTEECRGKINDFRLSETGFYAMRAVVAVNKETAVAIAMAEMLNEDDRVATLLKIYMEDSERDWALDSLDELSPGSAKDLDRLLSKFSESARKSLFDGLVELIKVCRWDPAKYESEWVNPKDKPSGAVEVATPNGMHRAWCRNEQDIPHGWVRADELPSPGQLSLI